MSYFSRTVLSEINRTTVEIENIRANQTSKGLIFKQQNLYYRIAITTTRLDKRYRALINPAIGIREIVHQELELTYQLQDKIDAAHSKST